MSNAEAPVFHGTTIVSVRRGRSVALGGDGPYVVQAVIALRREYQRVVVQRRQIHDLADMFLVHLGAGAMAAPMGAGCKDYAEMVPSGAGSVILLTGAPGDPIVNLHDHERAALPVVDVDDGLQYH